jgi:hypothetical protein
MKTLKELADLGAARQAFTQAVKDEVEKERDEWKANHDNQIKTNNAELLEALEVCMKIIGPPHALESECWATTNEINAAWDKGTAAIAKAKGKL